MNLDLWQSVLIGAGVGVLVWFLRQYANGRISLGRKIGLASDLRLADRAIPDGSALLYIARVGLMGGGIGFEVALDGQFVAKLRSLRYVRLVLPAGDHTIVAGPKGWMTGSRPPATLTFRAEAGEIFVYTLSLARDTLTRDKILLTREMDVPAAIERLAAMKNIPAKV